MPGHFIKVCKHGDVISQCRCPNPNKRKMVVPCDHPDAEKKESQ